MAHTRRPKDHHAEAEVTRSDWHALVESIRDHPWAYIGGVAFVGVVIVTVAVSRQMSERHHRYENSELARALSNEELPLRLDALKRVAASDDVTDEAVYLLGETAFDAENYDEARAAFERVRDEFSQSQYVPTAVEGLGDIEAQQGNFENAAKLYQDIRDRWPTSFAARRQLFNIGRMNEKLGKLDEAITAYREQTTAFAESTVASEAQQALDRLKAAHPELFPEPTPAPETIEEDVTSAAPVAPAAPEVLAPAPAAPVTEPAAPADSAPVETAPGEIVPAEPAPAVDAPAAEVPAEPAPAEVAPAESAPATDAPVAPAPADAAPSEPAPAAPAQ